MSLAAMHLNLIVLGAELGYWQSLCGTPQTFSELADSTACDTRYTKEWCLAMAAGGTLLFEEQTQAYGIVGECRPAFDASERLIAACDVSSVTHNRSQLLDACRLGSASMAAEWEMLCTVNYNDHRPRA